MFLKAHKQNKILFSFKILRINNLKIIVMFSIKCVSHNLRFFFKLKVIYFSFEVKIYFDSVCEYTLLNI